MKFYITLLLSFILFSAFAQAPTDYFITKWDLSKTGTDNTSIVFEVNTSGNVNYSWETIPAGTSGTGIISGTTAAITGLPANATVRLYIDPTNFKSLAFYDGVSYHYSDNVKLMDVEQWGTTSWETMSYAFIGCENLNITAVDVPNLSGMSNMTNMFNDCRSLNGPPNINLWDTSTITNMYGLFFHAESFNQPISNWNTANVTVMSSMFSNATLFNQPIGNWNTRNVIDMIETFNYAISFNQQLDNWNTSNVHSMSSMFSYAQSFNQPIGNWNVSNVRVMINMFAYATSFNQALDIWNVSNVVAMHSMFARATSFNQSINNWNVSNVTSMLGMFLQATSFNQPLNNWNVANVNLMSSMFSSATSFNQPLNNWNVANVNQMNVMFSGATAFNQNIGNWNLNPNVTMINMLNNSGMDCNNYTDTIIGWSNNTNTPNGRSLGAVGMDYGMNALPNRNILTVDKGWTVIGDSQLTGNCGTLAVEDFSQNKFEIYPNPADDFIVVNTEENGTGTIFNSLGQTIKSVNLEEVNTTIDLSGLPTGVYTLQMKSNGKNYCKKIIKK